jgi:hypothetical protein
MLVTSAAKTESATMDNLDIKKLPSTLSDPSNLYEGLLASATSKIPRPDEGSLPSGQRPFETIDF